MSSMSPSLSSYNNGSEQDLDENCFFLKKEIILDPNSDTHGGVFGVPDHEFHSPRAVGAAKNRPYGDPTEHPEGTFISPPIDSMWNQ